MRCCSGRGGIGIGVSERLRHACTHHMAIILGLDQGDGDIGLEVENVISAFGLAPRMDLAAHDDAALGEGDLFANLGVQIPAGPEKGGRDEFGADVPFRELAGHYTYPCGRSWLRSGKRVSG